MTRRQIHALCRRMMRDLHLGRPLDVEQLRERLAARRGRPIICEPDESLGARSAFGFMWDDPRGIVIFYDVRTPPLHQTMIILHELSHLILGHPGEAIDHSYQREFSLISTDVITEVLGGPADTVKSRRGRRGRRSASLYSERIEWEAETMATILLSWTAQAGTRSASEDPFEEILSAT
jgi:hypothetical protein